MRVSTNSDTLPSETGRRDFLVGGFAMHIDNNIGSLCAFSLAACRKGFSRIGCMNVRAWTLTTPICLSPFRARLIRCQAR
jgi:hypothetical protein